MLHSERQGQQALIHMLDNLGDREAAVLGFHQIEGLLYAMACSPEPVKAADWFDLIWLSDDAPFADSGEARAFYRLLVNMARDISDAADKSCYRPGVNLHGRLSPAALTEWCDGFLIGHHYLENIWAIALDDLDEDDLYEQVGAALQWAQALADREPEWDEEPDEELLTMQLQFEQWLASYHAVHERWYGTDHQWQVEEYFEQMRAVAPDSRCPCGSGRKFRYCCLH